MLLMNKINFLINSYNSFYLFICNGFRILNDMIDYDDVVNIYNGVEESELESEFESMPELE